MTYEEFKERLFTDVLHEQVPSNKFNLEKIENAGGSWYTLFFTVSTAHNEFSMEVDTGYWNLLNLLIEIDSRFSCRAMSKNITLDNKEVLEIYFEEDYLEVLTSRSREEIRF